MALLVNRQSLQVFRVSSFGPLFQEDFDPIRGPDRNARPEEIRILAPDVTGERQSRSQHRPVLLIPASQTAPGFGFEQTIDLLANRFDQGSQVNKCRWNVPVCFSAFDQQNRQIPFCIGIRNFGRVEPEMTRCIALKELPNALSKDSTNQDVGIQNDHSASGSSSRAA